VLHIQHHPKWFRNHRGICTGNRGCASTGSAKANWCVLIHCSGGGRSTPGWATSTRLNPRPGRRQIRSSFSHIVVSCGSRIMLRKRKFMQAKCSSFITWPRSTVLCCTSTASGQPDCYGFVSHSACGSLACCIKRTRCVCSALRNTYVVSYRISPCNTVGTRMSATASC
jgi:hypothetical protein